MIALFNSIDESSTVKLLNINSELAGELLNLVDSKLDTLS